MLATRQEIKKVLPAKPTTKVFSGSIIIQSKIEALVTKTGLEISLVGALLVALIGLSFSFYLAMSAFPTNQAVKMAGLAVKTYYVDCGVARSGNGSQSSPFKSINSAIQTVGSGSIIMVKAGDCSADNRINVIKSNLTLEAQGEVITKGFTVFNLKTWQPISGVTIKNFKITNTGFDGIAGTGIIIAGNRNTIDGNYIYNTTRQGIYIYGVDYDANDNAIINNTVEYSGLNFTDMNAIGILANGAKAQNNTIRNNIVRNNNQSGIAIFLAGTSNIDNNTVYGNGAAGIHVGGSSSGNIIEKNTVYDNGKKTDDVYGIDLLKVGNNNIVRYNRVHNQHESINDRSISVNPGNVAGGVNSKFGTGGIRFDGGVPNSTIWNATGNKAYYNAVYNERTGMAVLNFNNVELDNNTIYNSGDSGMYFLAYNDARTNFGGLVVKNNIIHTAPKIIIYAVRPQSSWSSYPTFNSNIYYQASGAKFNWSIADVFTVKEVSFDDWKKLPAIIANKSDINSLTSDPLLVNPVAGNFGLGAGSPAINAGVSVGLAKDIGGAAIISNPDVGAYESAGKSICATKTCEQLGKSCGSQTDGCGGTLNCGACAIGQTCNNGVCQKVCNSRTCSGYYRYWFKKYYYSCTGQGCCAVYSRGVKCKWKY